MTNQPDERWRKKAEELLPCSCENAGELRPHWLHCPVRFRPAVAHALQEAFEEGRKVPIVNLGKLKMRPIEEEQP